MQRAIATVCLSGVLNEKLEAVAQAGFKAIEIFENDLVAFGGSAKDVGKMARDLGLAIIAFQPFRDFEGMPDDRRQRVFKRAERKFDVMEDLGCDLLMVCSNVATESLGGIDRAANDFAELGERARARGMRVAYEALAWGRHIHDYRDSWEIVRRADHAHIGLVLDTFHIFARNTDLKPIAAIPGDKIFLVQIADAPRLEFDYLSWGRHYRNFPGQGEFPLGQFMDQLVATGYQGPLSLEIFNDQFRAGSTKQVAIDGNRSLIFLQDEARRRAGPKANLPDQLPDRAKPKGVSFIEFALDRKGALAFETVLRGLGFRKSGQHVSKAVTRWSQGRINIVTNTEKNGFASAFNTTHGTSVCAIGLHVEDAVQTLDRAQRLLDTPFRQPVGPGELDIPAVRGLGGSLLYFIDDKTDLGRVWDIEFKPVRDQPAVRDAGLSVIDHISQSMHYEEMLTWVLFYNSLFDVEKTRSQDVVDPGGMVKSQVIETSDGVLRIPLNASQSNRTQSSRFLSESFGSGVQHIAFATDDIFRTVAQLEANGVKLLAIPENYYDDLEAKTDLPVDEVARLKAHNILYERDGTGEFFQVYTATVEDRFFFEVVERRSSYRGYGATNAQIRLAAQSRVSRPASLPRR